MPRHLYEMFDEDIFAPNALAPVAPLMSRFGVEGTRPGGETLTALMALGYGAVCHNSESALDRFVLLRESGPIKVGKLRKEATNDLLQFDQHISWSSDHLLYGIGVISPCLHLGKEPGPHWTLLLTAVFGTHPAARQRLGRLRQKLSGLPRSMAHEVLQDRNPFHTIGITVEYEADTALITKTTVGLPEKYWSEATAWAERHPLRSRLFLRELLATEEFAITYEAGEPTLKLSVSKYL